MSKVKAKQLPSILGCPFKLPGQLAWLLRESPAKQSKTFTRLSSSCRAPVQPLFWPVTRFAEQCTAASKPFPKPCTNQLTTLQCSGFKLINSFCWHYIAFIDSVFNLPLESNEIWKPLGVPVMSISLDLKKKPVPCISFNSTGVLKSWLCHS